MTQYVTQLAGLIGNMIEDIMGFIGNVLSGWVGLMVVLVAGLIVIIFMRLTRRMSGKIL